MQPTLNTQKLFLLFMTIFSQKLLAQVNPLNGAYQTTKIDAIIQAEDKTFELRRSYSSRSLHDGLFGFGWCTDFEKRIDLRRSDQVTLHDCRLSREVVYVRKREGLFERSELDPSHLAKSIELTTTGYLFKNASSQYSFSARGLLLELSDTQKKRIKVFYDSKSNLERIKISENYELKIRLDPGKRNIVSITGPPRIRLEYEYENRSLVKVTSNETLSTIYAYDAYHNLTSVEEPGKKSALFIYDLTHDRIQIIKSPDQCTETINYSQPEKGTYEMLATKKCPHSKPKISRYEFTVVKNLAGLITLKPLRMDSKSGRQTVSLQAP